MQSITPQERPAPRWLPGAMVGLCAAQPLLDVLSFWTQDLSWGSKLTLSLRLLIFLSVVLAGFLLSQRRRVYWICAAVCAALYAGHVFACLRAHAPFTAANLVSDATNYIRFIQLPLFTLAFITFLRRCKQGYASLERGITAAFWIIAAVMLLSALTGTDPYTYPNKQIGLRGWFYFANSQSAILSMLVPLALCPALRSGKVWRWLPVCGRDRHLNHVGRHPAREPEDLSCAAARRCGLRRGAARVAHAAKPAGSFRQRRAQAGEHRPARHAGQGGIRRAGLRLSHLCL